MKVDGSMTLGKWCGREHISFPGGCWSPWAGHSDPVSLEHLLLCPSLPHVCAIGAISFLHASFEQPCTCRHCPEAPLLGHLQDACGTSFYQMETMIQPDPRLPEKSSGSLVRGSRMGRGDLGLVNVLIHPFLPPHHLSSC